MEGKLRLSSSDEVEKSKGTEGGLPKVGKAVLTLTLAPAIDLGSLKGSCSVGFPGICHRCPSHMHRGSQRGISCVKLIPRQRKN